MNTMKVYEVTGWKPGVGQEVEIQAYSAAQAVSIFNSLFPGEKFSSYSVNGTPFGGAK